MKDPDLNETDDPSGHDQMTIRQWYHSTLPPADLRQGAIDRLLDSASRPRLQAPVERRKTWIAAVALAAALVLAVSMAQFLRGDGAVAPDPAYGPNEKLIVFQVRLPSRSVSEVALTGDFNGWSTNATPMHREGSSDIWKASVALPPGRHVYSFVVDRKEWVIDPLAPRAEFDELGPANVIAIPGTGD